MMIENGWHPEFIVVSPQCPEDEFWNVDLLEKLVKKLLSTYNIDKQRMYLTGLSMGGFGAWAYAIKYPDRWSAIVPICGGGDPDKAHRIAHIPMISYHGAEAQTVPLERSQEMVEAVNAAGGEANLVIYPEKGHDSWTDTYYERTLYQWLLEK
jgi:predicted peptidase